MHFATIVSGGWEGKVSFDVGSDDQTLNPHPVVRIQVYSVQAVDPQEVPQAVPDTL